MGGGGMIRAAAKVGIGGGLGIITNGIRYGGGSANFHPAGASKPVSSVINLSSSPEVAVGDVEKPVLDFDDWEFAGGESDVLSKSGEGFPRTVFGPSPTMKEAEEATKDLKDALDKVYLSSSESTGWVPMLVGRVPGLSVLTNSDQSETVISSSAPENALQAFKLLSESTAAQTVVASIACDQNVWNAVLGNPALLEFLDSQKNTGTRFEEIDKDSDSRDTPSRFEFIPDFSVSGRSGIGLAITVQSIKMKVLEMISSVTDMLHNIFGPSKSVLDDGDEDGRFSTVDKTVGMSLMGLAVMAIMVVLLKRS